MTGTSKDALITQVAETTQKVILDWIPYTYYPILFQKDKANIWALIDLGNEINAMTPAYAKQLGLKTWETDIKVQKINDLCLEIYQMVIVDFQVINKLGNA